MLSLLILLPTVFIGLVSASHSIKACDGSVYRNNTMCCDGGDQAVSTDSYIYLPDLHPDYYSVAGAIGACDGSISDSCYDTCDDYILYDQNYPAPPMRIGYVTEVSSADNSLTMDMYLSDGELWGYDKIFDGDMYYQWTGFYDISDASPELNFNLNNADGTAFYTVKLDDGNVLPTKGKEFTITIGFLNSKWVVIWVNDEIYSTEISKADVDGGSASLKGGFEDVTQWEITTNAASDDEFLPFTFKFWYMGPSVDPTLLLSDHQAIMYGDFIQVKGYMNTDEMYTAKLKLLLRNRANSQVAKFVFDWSDNKLYVTNSYNDEAGSDPSVEWSQKYWRNSDTFDIQMFFATDGIKIYFNNELLGTLDYTFPLDKYPMVEMFRDNYLKVESAELVKRNNCSDRDTQSGYRGTVSITKGGYTCQRWDTQSPHTHTRTPEKYPNSGLDSNYCRNPDSEYDAWCYTTDPDKRYDYCDVSRCEDGTKTMYEKCVTQRKPIYDDLDKSTVTTDYTVNSFYNYYECFMKAYNDEKSALLTTSWNYNTKETTYSGYEGENTLCEEVTDSTEGFYFKSISTRKPRQTTQGDKEQGWTLFADYTCLKTIEDWAVPQSLRSYIDSADSTDLVFSTSAPVEVLYDGDDSDGYGVVNVDVAESSSEATPAVSLTLDQERLITHVNLDLIYDGEIILKNAASSSVASVSPKPASEAIDGDWATAAETQNIASYTIHWMEFEYDTTTVGRIMIQAGTTSQTKTMTISLWKSGSWAGNCDTLANGLDVKTLINCPQDVESNKIRVEFSAINVNNIYLKITEIQAFAAFNTNVKLYGANDVMVKDCGNASTTESSATVSCNSTAGQGVLAQKVMLTLPFLNFYSQLSEVTPYGIVCGAGSYIRNRRECLPCPSGTISSDTDWSTGAVTQCTKCDGGSYPQDYSTTCVSPWVTVSTDYVVAQKGDRFTLTCDFQNTDGSGEMEWYMGNSKIDELYQVNLTNAKEEGGNSQYKDESFFLPENAIDGSYYSNSQTAGASTGTYTLIWSAEFTERAMVDYIIIYGSVKEHGDLTVKLYYEDSVVHTCTSPKIAGSSSTLYSYCDYSGNSDKVALSVIETAEKLNLVEVQVWAKNYYQDYSAVEDSGLRLATVRSRMIITEDYSSDLEDSTATCKWTDEDSLVTVSETISVDMFDQDTRVSMMWGGAATIGCYLTEDKNVDKATIYASDGTTVLYEQIYGDDAESGNFPTPTPGIDYAAQTRSSGDLMTGFSMYRSMWDTEGDMYRYYCNISGIQDANAEDGDSLKYAVDVDYILPNMEAISSSLKTGSWMTQMTDAGNSDDLDSSTSTSYAQDGDVDTNFGISSGEMRFSFDDWQYVSMVVIRFCQIEGDYCSYDWVTDTEVKLYYTNGTTISSCQTIEKHDTSDSHSQTYYIDCYGLGADYVGISNSNNNLNIAEVVFYKQSAPHWSAAKVQESLPVYPDMYYGDTIKWTGVWQYDNENFNIKMYTQQGLQKTPMFEFDISKGSGDNYEILGYAAMLKSTDWNEDNDYDWNTYQTFYEIDYYEDWKATLTRTGEIRKLRLKIIANEDVKVVLYKSGSKVGYCGDSDGAAISRVGDIETLYCYDSTGSSDSLGVEADEIWIKVKNDDTDLQVYEVIPYAKVFSKTTSYFWDTYWAGDYFTLELVPEESAWSLYVDGYKLEMTDDYTDLMKDVINPADQLWYATLSDAELDSEDNPASNALDNKKYTSALSDSHGGWWKATISGLETVTHVCVYKARRYSAIELYKNNIKVGDCTGLGDTESYQYKTYECDNVAADQVKFTGSSGKYLRMYTVKVKGYTTTSKVQKIGWMEYDDGADDSMTMSSMEYVSNDNCYVKGVRTATTVDNSRYSETKSTATTRFDCMKACAALAGCKSFEWDTRVSTGCRLMKTELVNGFSTNDNFEYSRISCFDKWTQVRSGSRATLTCSFGNLPEEASFSWLDNYGSSLSNNDTINIRTDPYDSDNRQQKSYLALSSVTTRRSYTCVIQPQDGPSARFVYAVKPYEFSVSNDPTALYSILDESVSARCTLNGMQRTDVLTYKDDITGDDAGQTTVQSEQSTYEFGRPIWNIYADYSESLTKIQDELEFSCYIDQYNADDLWPINDYLYWTIDQYQIDADDALPNAGLDGYVVAKCKFSGFADTMDYDQFEWTIEYWSDNSWVELQDLQNISAGYYDNSENKLYSPEFLVFTTDGMRATCGLKNAAESKTQLINVWTVEATDLTGLWNPSSGSNKFQMYCKVTHSLINTNTYGDDGTLGLTGSDGVGVTSADAAQASNAVWVYGAGTDNDYDRTDTFTYQPSSMGINDKTFTCKFEKSDYGDVSIQDTLTLDMIEMRIRPNVTREPVTGDISVTLPCCVLYSNDVPLEENFKWYKDGSVVSGNQYWDSDTRSLVLVIGTQAADQTYTCTYKDDINNNLAQTSGVDVFNFEAESAYYVQSASTDDVKLTCSFTSYDDGYYSGEWKWYNQVGDTFTGDFDVTTTSGNSKSVLTLSASDLNQDDIYTCMTNNQLKWHSKYIYLDWFAMSVSQSELSMLKGERFTVTCDVSGLDIEPTTDIIKWKLSGASSSISDSDKGLLLDGTTLTYSAVASTDATYLCQVYDAINGNMIGEKSVDVDVFEMTPIASSVVKVKGVSTELTFTMTGYSSSLKFNTEMFGWMVDNDDDRKKRDADGFVSSTSIDNTNRIYKYTLTDDDVSRVYVRFKPGNTTWESYIDISVFYITADVIEVEKGSSAALVAMMYGAGDKTISSVSSWSGAATTYTVGRSLGVTWNRAAVSGSAGSYKLTASYSGYNNADMDFQLRVTLSNGLSYTLVMSIDVFEIITDDGAGFPSGDTVSVTCQMSGLQRELNVYDVTWTSDTAGIDFDSATEGQNTWNGYITTSPPFTPSSKDTMLFTCGFDLGGVSYSSQFTIYMFDTDIWEPITLYGETPVSSLSIDFGRVKVTPAKSDITVKDQSTGTSLSFTYATGVNVNKKVTFKPGYDLNDQRVFEVTILLYKRTYTYELTYKMFDIVPYPITAEQASNPNIWYKVECKIVPLDPDWLIDDSDLTMVVGSTNYYSSSVWDNPIWYFTTDQISRDYTDEIKCGYTYDTISISRSIDIDVFQITDSSDTHVLAGTDATLTCVFSDIITSKIQTTNNYNQLRWYNEDTDLSSQASYTTVGQLLWTLTLDSSDIVTDSIYTCSVFFDWPEGKGLWSSKTVNVDLFELAVTASETSVPVGQTITLTCELIGYDGVIAESDLWFSVGNRKESGGSWSKTSTTRFTQEFTATSADTIFYCNVNAHGGTQKQPISIDTFTLTSNSGSVTKAKGKDTQLTYTMSGYNKAAYGFTSDMFGWKTLYGSNKDSEGFSPSTSVDSTNLIYKYTLTDDADQTVYTRFQPSNTIWESQIDVTLFYTTADVIEVEKGGTAKLEAIAYGVGTGQNAISSVIAWSGAATVYHISRNLGATWTRASQSDGTYKLSANYGAVNADMDFQLKVTLVSGLSYTLVVSIDVFEITNDVQGFQSGESATVTCKLEGLQRELTVYDVYWSMTSSNSDTFDDEAIAWDGSISTSPTFTLDGTRTATCGFKAPIASSDTTKTFTVYYFSTSSKQPITHYNAVPTVATSLWLKDFNSAYRPTRSDISVTNAETGNAVAFTYDAYSSGGIRIDIQPSSKVMEEVTYQIDATAYRVSYSYYLKYKVIEIVPYSMTRMSGTRSTLTCKVQPWSDSIDPDGLTWRTEQVGSDYLSGGAWDNNQWTLDIGAVSTDKTYTCSYTDSDAGPEVLSKTLTVDMFKIIDSADTHVLSGNAVTLTCQFSDLITSKVSSSDLKWTSGETTYSSRSTLTQTSGNYNNYLLKLESSFMTRDMEFTCSIYFDGAWHSKSVFVDFFEIGLTASDTAVPVGETFSLTCRLIGLDRIIGTDMVYWSTGGTTLTGGYYEKPEYIQEVTADQDRTYTCNVKYAGVAQTESISIDTFSFALRDRVKIVGTDQTITCGTTGLASSLTSDRIKWTTQKKSITEDIYGTEYTVESFSGGSLTKTVTRDEDQLYTCHIKADNTWWYDTMILDVFDIVNFEDQKFVYGRVESYTDTCKIIGLRDQFAVTNRDNRVWIYPKKNDGNILLGSYTYSTWHSSYVGWNSASMELTLTQRLADYNHDKTFTCKFVIDSETFKKNYYFDIEESCEVKKTSQTSYTTLTSNGDYSTLSTNDRWVRDGTTVSINCDQGYILDAGNSYSYTCSVPSGTIYRNNYTPAGCKAGCWIQDPSVQSGDQYTTAAGDLAARRSNTLYSYADNSNKLTGSGYTTVHTGTISKVIMSCSGDYTRLSSWASSTSCTSGSSVTKQLSFPGLCVLGCRVTIGTYTSYTAYIPGNSNTQNLLAQSESITYSCVDRSWTATGTKSYTFTCVDGAAAALNECQLVSVVDPAPDTNIGSVRVTMGVPTHPSTAPSQYTVKLWQVYEDADDVHLQTFVVTSGNIAAFDGLTNNTNYKITYTMTFAGGVHEDLGEYTFTSEQADLEHKKDDHHAYVDVPKTDFTVTKYQLLALYKVKGYGDDYDLTEEYYDFKYVGAGSDDACDGITKRDITFYQETGKTRKCVKIYDGPWYMEQFDDEIAAFIVNDDVETATVGGLDQLEVDVDDLNLRRKDHTMDLWLRACKTTDNESCFDGSSIIIVQESHLERILLLVLLIPIAIIILLLLIACCYRSGCRCRIRMKSKKTRARGSAGANVYGTGSAGIHANPIAFEKTAAIELDYNERGVDTEIPVKAEVDVEASGSVEVSGGFSLNVSTM